MEICWIIAGIGVILAIAIIAVCKYVLMGFGVAELVDWMFRK